ncbi:MAG: hypothetical protein EP343_07415 [Deltaproteobacteria bacterium]|nr:MAG: hypothetical protein EP343_07415 [Deltaproteobacteria bacterium]
MMNTTQTEQKVPLHSNQRLQQLFWGCGLLFVVFVFVSVTSMGCGLTQKPHHQGMTCANCHFDRSAELASHKTLDIDCSQCHTKTEWAPAIPHQGSTLKGKHTTLLCSECHKQDPPEKVTQVCYTCHQPDYEKAKNPDHVATNYSKECSECHSQTGWKPAALDHDKFWPLTGKHKDTDCAKCHINNVYKGTPRNCFGCHETDYKNTKNPDHAAVNYATNCETCHSTTAWQPSTFDHDQFFKLEGKHKTALCTSCHKNNVYKGTPRTCVGCHQTEYDKTSSPNHKTSGFSTDCVSCHSQAAWKPATFDHDKFYKLEGKHKTTSCTSCHQNGQFKGTPRNCVGCHQTDYNNTSNPNHKNSGFSTDCVSCHGQAAWKPATFDHERFFPLKQGNHSQYQNDCGACHKNTASYKDFTCTDCHEHSKPKMDAQHIGEVSGYVYESKACYKCHPQGN